MLAQSRTSTSVLSNIPVRRKRIRRKLRAVTDFCICSVNDGSYFNSFSCSSAQSRTSASVLSASRDKRLCACFSPFSREHPVLSESSKVARYQNIPYTASTRSLMRGVIPYRVFDARRHSLSRFKAAGSARKIYYDCFFRRRSSMI